MDAKSICTLAIRWAHIQKDEKTGEYPAIPAQNKVKCKIFFAPLCFFSEKGSTVFFDSFIGVAANSEIIFALCARRFDENLTKEDILGHVIPRIPDYATRDFVMAYAYGVNVEVAAIVPVAAMPHKIAYNDVNFQA
jgi:hypothetical protein